MVLVDAISILLDESVKPAAVPSVPPVPVWVAFNRQVALDPFTLELLIKQAGVAVMA